MKQHSLTNENAEEITSYYHEKQARELCALHALNNLFQSSRFTKQELDTICVNLSAVQSGSNGPLNWTNPHRSVLGTGNYDVNVVMTALSNQGLEAVWWDKRRPLETIAFSNVYGLILNVNSWMSWGLVTIPFKRKHWIAVRKINEFFVNLDSKLKQPVIIGQTDLDIIEFLSQQLHAKEAELLLVVTPEVANEKSWILS